MEYILSGTFKQIESAQELLQGIFHRSASVTQESKEGNEVTQGDTTQTQQNSQETFDTDAIDNVDAKDHSSFEVQPQFMKLLKRVYKGDLQDIEERYGVEIVWSETASHVQLHPSKTSNNQHSYQEGCDAFIDLYQNFFLNMRREEVELKSTDIGAVEAITSVETENDVVIEKIGNKIVVYAEKNKINSSLQVLKEKLGLPQGGSRKTRRSQKSPNPGAREHNEIDQEDRLSALPATSLKQLLSNGVNFSLYQSDITGQRVDAIVNAANEWLQHGGGVAAAIVRKGGRQIEDDSREIMSHRNRRPLDVGDAVYTSGGNLPCRFVIHTVGPRWHDYDRRKSILLLRRACVESLRLAAKLKLCSIALPAISSGIFGMPKNTCAQVMFDAVEEFSSSTDAEFSTLRDVRIVIIDDETISFFREEFVRRYTSQETSQTNATSNGKQEEQEGSFASNATVEPLSFSPANEPPEKLSKKNGKDSDNAETSNERLGLAVESSGNPKEVLDSNKEVHPSNKNIPNANKACPPTDNETPDVQTEAYGINNETGFKASASVESPELSNMNTDARPSSGRGRGFLAANFSGRPYRGPGSKSSKDTQSHDSGETKNADAGRGRGMTYATTSYSPPGLTVTDEGRHLARNHGEEMKDELNTVPVVSRLNENKGTENNESSKEALKENQEPKHDIQNTDKDKLNDEFLGGHSEDQNTSSHTQLDQDGVTGSRLLPDGGITDTQGTQIESSDRSATDGGSKLPTKENKPNKSENETETIIQVDQLSSGATNDETTYPEEPSLSNQSGTSQATKEETSTASPESVNERDTVGGRRTAENPTARSDGGKKTLLSICSKILKYSEQLLKYLKLLGQLVK